MRETFFAKIRETGNAAGATDGHHGEQTMG